MYKLENYERIIVQQRKRMHCIPASIEWLLKYNNINSGFSWDDFQERVCCCCEGNNSFNSITQKIEDIYGYSKNNFKDKGFNKNIADEKCNEIKRLIDDGKGCIVSIAQVSSNQLQGFHIQPAVEYNNDNLFVLDLYLPINTQKTPYSWVSIEALHTQCDGGHDILWLI